ASSTTSLPRSTIPPSCGRSVPVSPMAASGIARTSSMDWRRLRSPSSACWRGATSASSSSGWTDRRAVDYGCQQSGRRGIKTMSQTIQEENKALVLEAFDTLFNRRDYAAAKRFWSSGYIQHSAHIAPGREGLFELVRGLPPTLRYEPGLIVADGD